MFTKKQYKEIEKETGISKEETDLFFSEERAKKSKERMGPFLAVFNQHVNNAEERALSLMKEFFPKHYAEIAPINEKGIMAIFEKQPTEAALIYAALITAFVNEEGKENA